VGLYGITAQV